MRDDPVVGRRFQGGIVGVRRVCALLVEVVDDALQFVLRVGRDQ